MNIIVDAMGGDNAPEAVVIGCMHAIREQNGFNITLVGKENEILKILKENNFNDDRLKITNATEVIDNEESPIKAFRAKKDSSMVVGLKLIKEGQGSVFLSAGNTGALMTSSLLTLGRIKGVDRPALSFFFPSKLGPSLIIDAGANTSCKPINFLQFGIMGSIYMKEVFELKSPTVGLINVGSEENKGNETIKQAYNLLSESGVNFKGNIEGREIPEGGFDVIVCDGFVGNVILKFAEGMAKHFIDSIKGVYKKNIFTKLSALVIRKQLTEFKKSLDYTEYGGVPLLGIDGKVIKCHGSSNAKTFKNAIIKATDFAKSTVEELIREEFKNIDFKGTEVEVQDE